MAGSRLCKAIKESAINTATAPSQPRLDVTCTMNSGLRRAGLMASDLEPREQHEGGGIAVNTSEFRWDGVAADEPADANAQPAFAREVVHVAEREFAHPKFLFGARVAFRE